MRDGSHARSNAAVAVLAVLLTSSLAASRDEVVTDEEGHTTQRSESVPISLPELSEEEHISLGIPAEQRCRACQAVTYQLKQALSIQRRRKGNKRLSETVYLETMEEVCEATTIWDGYGYKEFAGGNILQGPGILKQEDAVKPNAPAVSFVTTRKGGYWGHRLKEYCNSMLGKHDEDEIYEVFERCTSDQVCPSFVHAMCDKTCGGIAPIVGEEGIPSKVEELPFTTSQGKNEKKKKKKKKKSEL